MKRLLLSLGLLLGLTSLASAQCVGVGSINNAPPPGIICQQDSVVPTYHAVGVAIAVGTAPTDVSCITGSATKVIRLKKVRLSGTAGTAINISVYLTKHVAANTGGTAATGTALPTAYPMDSTNPTVSATLTAYTANPTIADAASTVINSATLFLPVTSTATGQNAVVFDWGSGGIAVQGPILRGIAQQVCVNLNGVTAPSSGLLNVQWVWTELAS